jgi:hypothetical protein
MRRAAPNHRSNSTRWSCTHRRVEGSHRAAAWRTLLEHVEPEARAGVVAAMELSLERWLAYRDEVAEACGIERDQGDDSLPCSTR